MQPANNLTIAPELSKLFTPESEIPKAMPRMAISVEALDKRGKTHFALMTTPDPIALVTNDPGTQMIVAKAQAAGRRIHQLVLPFDPPKKLTKRSDEINKEEWERWVDLCNKHIEFMDALRRDRYFRTYVTDTETDLWHLYELAYFGKAAGNSNQDVRTKLNAAYKGAFWNLYKARPDLNMVLLHRLKKKYEKPKRADGKEAMAEWDGKSYEVDGQNQISYSVDFTLRLDWDDKVQDFVGYMDTTKPFRQFTEDNKGVMQKRFYATSNTDPIAFWNLGYEIYPETLDTPEVWGQK